MGEPLLAVEGIRKRFGGLHVLNGVELRLGAGEVKCIIGPNGCGKSTLFNILSGVLRPDAGRCVFDGQRTERMPAHRIARLGMLRKFQVPGVLAGLSVLENLELARVGAAGSSVAGSLRGLPVDGYATLLREAGLFDLRFAPVEQLPHGAKQRLELLMLVSRGPRLLLLDEPTAGMTAQETADTVRLIHRISGERGIAVLAIEHDMRFVRDLECPIVVMLGGVVQSEGDYESVRQDPRVRAAYLGEAA